MKKLELLKEIELLRSRVDLLEKAVRYLTGNIGGGFWMPYTTDTIPLIGDHIVTWPGIDEAQKNIDKMRTHTA